MPSPETQFLFESTFTEDDWDEVMNPDARSDTLSPDRSSCVVPIKVTYSKYKAAIKWCLGYQWVDQSNKLRRATPAFHPTYPWLFCAAITSVRFEGPNAANTYTGPYLGSVYAGGYTHAIITVEFRELRYEVWEDEDVDYEYERFVELLRKPYAELAQIDGGQLKAHAPGISSMLTSQPFISAPYILAKLAKVKFDLVWHLVPTDFVESPLGFSQKFLAAQKCVNKTSFMGWRAGTLLLEDIDTEKSPSPVATDVGQANKFTYKVTFHLIGYDPTPVGDPSVAKFGHNLLPGHLGGTTATTTGTTAGTGRAFAFFYYTDNGAITGKPLFAEYEFAALFTHYTELPL